MAVLYITEYARQGFDQDEQHIAAPAEPALAEQHVAIGVSSAASSAFQHDTALVRLHTDAICSIAFGVATPTAVATARRMAANTTEYFAVPKGASFMVAVITNT